MSIKLVLSDIDGTILDDSQQIDSSLKRQLEKMKQQKIPFVLASARSPEAMLPIAKELGILDNPVACYNGAYVVKNLDQENVEVITSHTIPPTETKKIFNILEESFPSVSINLYSKMKWYIETADQWNQQESAITKLEPIKKDLQIFIEDHPVHKFLLIDQAKTIHQLMEHLEKSGLKDCSFVLSKDNYLEVTNKKASKKIVLKELTQHYGIDSSETMTIGDNFNDVPMLVRSGFGVAMNSAPDGVKKVADWITTDNNHHGVSHALSENILNKLA